MSDPLNAEFLDELREIMDDDFGLLLRTYLSESARQYEDVRRAWDEGSDEDLRRNAHALKSTCGNVGAERLSALFLDLEQRARSHDLDDVDGLFEYIEVEMANVSDAVRAIHGG